MGGGMEVNKNRWIEEWNAGRENLEFNFRWTRRSLAVVGLFRLAVPILVYKGIVREFPLAPPIILLDSKPYSFTYPPPLLFPSAASQVASPDSRLRHLFLSRRRRLCCPSPPPPTPLPPRPSSAASDLRCLHLPQPASAVSAHLLPSSPAPAPSAGSCLLRPRQTGTASSRLRNSTAQHWNDGAAPSSPASCLVALYGIHATLVVAGISAALALCIAVPRGSKNRFFNFAFLRYTVSLTAIIIIVNWFQSGQAGRQPALQCTAFGVIGFVAVHCLR
nr:unnamed protein product [Digitaria exilis]